MRVTVKVALDDAQYDALAGRLPVLLCTALQAASQPRPAGQQPLDDASRADRAPQLLGYTHFHGSLVGVVEFVLPTTEVPPAGDVASHVRRLLPEGTRLQHLALSDEICLGQAKAPAPSMWLDPVVLCCDDGVQVVDVVVPACVVAALPTRMASHVRVVVRDTSSTHGRALFDQVLALDQANRGGNRYLQVCGVRWCSRACGCRVAAWQCWRQGDPGGCTNGLPGCFSSCDAGCCRNSRECAPGFCRR